MSGYTPWSCCFFFLSYLEVKKGATVLYFLLMFDIDLIVILHLTYIGTLALTIREQKLK